MGTKKEIPRPKKIMPGQRPTPEDVEKIFKVRTWAEMAIDIEKEQDAKARELFTPEYLKRWKDNAEPEGDE